VLRAGLPQFQHEGLLPLGAFLRRPAAGRRLGAGIRLAALLHGSGEDFLLITIVTGTPAMLVLTAWSIRYAIRNLSAPEENARAPTSQACA
jgi:hypothetical protein